jgi:pimeloyl-ACP methyl ester carboxylesterase
LCARAYQPLADVLARRLRVIGVDFRGHGDSSAPPNANYSWTSMAEDVIAVARDTATEGPLYGFGHSMGGAVLLLAESRQPGLLAALYLFEPIVLASQGEDDGQSAALAGAARSRRREFESGKAALWRFAGRPPFEDLQAASLLAYIEHGMAQAGDGRVHLKCSPEAEALSFEGAGKPSADDLATLAVPATIAIGGTLEGWSPSRLGRRAAASLPGAKLEEHPFLGHFGPLESPREIGEMALRSFAAE